MKIKLFTALTIISAFIFIFAGCEEEEKVYIHSGFLDNYSRLEADPNFYDIQVWQNDRVDISRYSKFMFDEPEIIISPECKFEVTDEDKRLFSEYFKKALTDIVGKRYTVVDKPGPDVLRVRTAVTNVKPVDGMTNLISNAAIKMNIDLGKASMEAEFLDSRSNKTVMMWVDTRQGAKFFNAFEGIDKWGHVKAAFRHWAKLMRVHLDNAHGCEEEKQFLFF